MTPVEERVWLLDAPIYFFRGLFGGYQHAVDARGASIAGLCGVAAALLALLQRHGRGAGAVFFDESLGTCFRNALYPPYKANRPPADANIRWQFEQCHRLCEALGLPHWADTAFEADDLIATALRRNDASTIIYSKDKDLRQLLDVNTNLADLYDRRSMITADSFHAEFGFLPSQFPDYQALVGDSGDNIPGVPGVGPKTARVLIARYKTLSAALASEPHWAADGVTLRAGGAVAKALRSHAEQAVAMLELLRLADDAPLPGGAVERGPVVASDVRRALVDCGMPGTLRKRFDSLLEMS